MNAFLAPLSAALFPGLPAGASVHNGFRDAHAATATLVLNEVKRLLAATGYTSVTTVRSLSAVVMKKVLTGW